MTLIKRLIKYKKIDRKNRHTMMSIIEKRSRTSNVYEDADILDSCHNN